MMYVHEIQELLGAFPQRSFRIMEIVRYATKGQARLPRHREAARKAVRRALDALVDAGTVEISHRPVIQKSAFEYRVSQKWDISPENLGQKVGQFPRAISP